MTEMTRTIRETTVIPGLTRERFLPLDSPAGRKLVSRGILMAGITSASAGFEIGRIGAPYNILLFSLEGAGLLVTREGSRKLEPGDLYIGPIQHNDHMHLCDGDYWKSIFIRVADSEAWSEIKRRHHFISPHHDARDIETTMENFINESLLNRKDSGVILDLYADLFLAYLERELSFLGPKKNREFRERLSALWSDVNDRLDLPWTNARLAERMGLSISHLTRICLQLYKKTPMQFVTQLKMNKAQVFLVRTDWPVNKISESLGYSNQFAFSVAFSRHAGISPSLYRKIAINESLKSFHEEEKRHFSGSEEL